MKFKTTLILAMAALLASCADKEPSPSVDREAAIAEINALRSQFEQAVASGDMAALGALALPDAILIQPGAADWKSMQQAASGAPFPQGAKIHITPFETVIVSAEWAFERGSSVVTYPNPENGDVIVLRDSYLVIFQHDGGGWKVFREVASASQPPEGWPVFEKD